MNFLIFLFLIFFGTQTHAQDLQFNRYHSQDEINQFLRDEATRHPDLVHFTVLGKSKEGREISYVAVTKTPGTPALYYNGTHHGDEWSSTEAILGLIDYLVTHKDDANIDGLLKAYTFYLQPLVNPDGHAARTREDSLGRDPNRDYAYAKRSEAKSFKVPEIALVKKLMDQIHPRAAAAYHSGIQEVLWSWCYTSKGTPDADLLEQITQKTAESMGMNRYMQSYYDYPSDGEFIDYAYMKYHTVALTFEISDDKPPPAADLAAIVQNSIRGALTLATMIQNKDLGLIHVHPGQYLRDRLNWTPSHEALRLE